MNKKIEIKVDDELIDCTMEFVAVSFDNDNRIIIKIRACQHCGEVNDSIHRRYSDLYLCDICREGVK